MVGECIRKNDQKKLIYRLLVDTSSNLNFSICEDDEWYLIGDQYTFELGYQFINELEVATILKSLDDGFLDEDYYPKFIRKINNKRDFDEMTIVKWHLKKPEKLHVICKGDISEEYEDSTIQFKKKCKYEGIKIEDVGYLFIGEPFPWEEGYFQIVNGKVISLFPTTNLDILSAFFVIPNELESLQDAWKRYEKELHIKQFDL